jgi:hypothetical protein
MTLIPIRFAVAGISIPMRELAPDISAKVKHYSGGKRGLEDMHVRSFVAANSRPSKDGLLRIKESGIKALVAMYPGAPVMRNHSLGGPFGGGSDDMPLGKVIDASTRPGTKDSTELVLDFMMSKRDPLGDRAATLIDDGIWSECSIHALFNDYDCSICGKTLDPEGDDPCDEHVPGRKYKNEMARIELDAPEEAPEFSLCWSGRLEGTRALSREMPGTMTAVQFMEKRTTWIEGLLGRRAHGTQVASAWASTVFASGGKQ